MKRLLLSFVIAICAIACTKAAEWGLVGAFNNWDTTTYEVMEEQPDGKFSITLAILEGDFKFACDNGWAMNFGASRVEEISGNCIVGVKQDGRNFKAPVALENVTIILDPEAKKVEFSGLPTNQVVPSDDEPVITEGHFLIGDPVGGFSYDKGKWMTEVSKGVYNLKTLLIEDQYIGFTSALVDLEYKEGGLNPWNIFRQYRYSTVPVPEGNVADLTIPYEATLACPAEADMSWKVMETGYYDITLDATQKSLTVKPVEGVWSVIGSFSDWESDIDMTPVGGDCWRVVLEDFSGEFKFRFAHSWAYNLGAALINEGILTVSADELPTYKCDLDGYNFYVPEKVEKLGMILDPINMYVFINNTGFAGIDNISTEDEAPVYFNMQGMRVTNPEKGIYIRVTGQNTEKVVR